MFGSTFTGNDDEPEDYFTWEQRTMNTPNTAANGGQTLTDERILEIAQIAGKRYDSVNSMTTQATLEIGRAIEADLRASRAAVPASEPVKRWPFVESPGDFAMRLSGALNTFNGDTLAAVRNVLIENPATLAAPAPVSGMPDLAARLNEIDRHLAKCRFTERHKARGLVYSMLHEVCGTPVSGAVVTRPDDVTVLRRWAEQVDQLALSFTDERSLLCQQAAILLHRIAYRPAPRAPDTPNTTGETK